MFTEINSKNFKMQSASRSLFFPVSQAWNKKLPLLVCSKSVDVLLSSCASTLTFLIRALVLVLFDTFFV